MGGSLAQVRTVQAILEPATVNLKCNIKSYFLSPKFYLTLACLTWP
jgi:hypothetical protein